MFGRLTVINREPSNKHGHAMWLCRCVCGGVAVASTNDLRRGNTKSCGCLSRETTEQNNRKKTGLDKKVWGTPSYKAYIGAKQRCGNPNNPAWERYGGRGIMVKMTFKEMIEDIGEKPAPRMSLDRIDVNGNYEVGNIRWATDTQQARNQRRTTTAGVFWRNGKWRAYIGVDKKLIHLGTYSTESEARRARNKAVIEYWK